jgi:hypothetical protein
MYFSTVFISIQSPLTPKSDIASSQHILGVAILDALRMIAVVLK